MSRPMTSSFGTSDWFAATIKSRPEGLLLLAAGCALLLRSGSASRSSEKNGSRGAAADHARGESHHDGGAYRPDKHGVGEKLSNATEGAREYASGAREYASEVAEQASDTASSYMASAATYARDAGRTMSEQSERFARQAQSTVQQAQSTVRGTMNQVLQNQPLALALVGLAAGAALAATFPPTDAEKRTLGPTGDHLMDAVAKTGTQIKDATARAGERLMTSAEEHGLSADGLKEMARDAAGAFGSTFSGEQPQAGEKAHAGEKARAGEKAKPDAAAAFRSQSSAASDTARSTTFADSSEKRGPR